MSVASIAKATLCLKNPSIITSLVCQSIYHPTLWSPSLSFTPPEPRLRSPGTSPGFNILPARVSTNAFSVSIFYKLITQIKYKIEIKHLLINTNLSSFIIWKGSILTRSKLKSSRKNKIKISFKNFQTMFVVNLIENWLKLFILLAGDVELNPGPLNITLATLNCRGLKKYQKFRQLINRINTLQNSSPNLIITLKETHLEKNSLKYIWKGQHIFTESDGSGSGVITLLSDNIIVREQIDIGQDMHIALVDVLENRNKTELILANIHSPCAHNKDKLAFFKSMRTEIDKLRHKYPDAKTIISGDFNTTFKDKERCGTIRSNAEMNIANKINSYFNDLNLIDCWESDSLNQMTWRHGEKMSRLDRIQWSSELEANILKVETDWTYTQSDHCVVIVKLGSNARKAHDKIVRIDTLFMSNVLLKHKFLSELSTRIEQIKDTNMNPHQKLEFLKMTIRSLAIEIAPNHRKERENEMNTLRRETCFSQNALETATSDSFRTLATTKMDEIICKRDKLLDDLGEFICNRLKSRWFQEGEKGTKYFLNM